MSDENKTIDSNQFRPIVGIDLGTTNSAVAYISNGKPQIICSPRGESIIPSVVLIDPNGKVIIGEDARAALVAMPDRTIAAVKRRMGSSERIALAEEALLPQEISALILKELKTYVDALYGEGEKEAVITVPAYFTDEQRRATKEAGELAGFVVERIINEPTAAALAFGLEHLDEDRVFLVYDLGGGTFDVSVVEMMGGVLEVKATAGNRELGGEDFDWRLVDWFAEKMLTESGIDLREDIRAKALMKEEAEKVKMLLSEELTVSVMIPLVTVKDNQPIGLTVEVTRDDFVGLIDDLLLESMQKVRDVLHDAGLTPLDIDEVLLVGGSTRIPRVHELIQEIIGKAPRTDINPDEAVALGAAVQAGLKSGVLADSGLVATDVAPFSMGIAVVKEWRKTMDRPGGFAPIIPRNTTIPVTRTQVFYTSAPGQTEVSVEIYQGEHEWVKNNHRLGEFLLDGIPANREQQEAIEVKFRYNLNGILEVAAKCVSTEQEMKVTVQDGLIRDSREAFQESLKSLETLWANADSNGKEEDDEQFLTDWDDLDDSFLQSLLAEDDEDDYEEDEDEDLTSAELHEEVRSLRERVLNQLDHLGAKDQEKGLQLIQAIDEVLQAEDVLEIQLMIDKATDLLIELELS